MDKFQTFIKGLMCLVLLIIATSSQACNFSTLSLSSVTSLGGGAYQFNLVMCTSGGCDLVDIFGDCIGAEMNDATGNFAIGIDNGGACITGFTPTLTSPQTSAVYSGALTTACTFVTYSNASNWWTFDDPGLAPSQQFCVNVQLTTNGVPVDICVYGLEGADDLYFNPACPQVVGVTCVQPGPLQVEFIDFRADLQNDAVQLNWMTAMELDHDRFIIEHSANGNHFSKIGELGGGEDSYETQQYGFDHLNPLEGSNHYRIGAVDRDGMYQYTNTIEIQYAPDEFKLARVFPVPGFRQCQIEFISERIRAFEVNVYALGGKVVNQKNFIGRVGRNIIEFDMNDWASGVYMAQVLSEGRVLNVKLIKR